MGFLQVTTNVPAIIEVDGLEVARTPAPGSDRRGRRDPQRRGHQPGPSPRSQGSDGGRRYDGGLELRLAPTDLLAAHIQVTANLPGPISTSTGRARDRPRWPARITVAPGSHLVEVRRDGYTPARREITLGSGAAGSLSFELQEDPAAAAPRGSLVLAVSEPEAEASVDGVRRGVYRSPLSLPAGPHRVAVMRAGFVPSERVMEVDAVSATTNRVSLTPTPETRAAYVDHAGPCVAGGGSRRWVARRWGLRAVRWPPRSGARSTTRARRATTCWRRSSRGDRATDGGRRQRVCQQRLNAANDDVDAHERWRAAGLVGAGVGVAALAVGATLLLTGDDPERYELAGAPAGGRRGDVAFRLGLSGTLPTVLVVGRFERATTGSP